MSDNPPVAPQSDLITRFAAGVVMIAVACTAIYVGGWLFRLLVAAGAAVMVLEWGDMHRLKRGYSYFALGVLAATLLAAAQYLYPVGEMDVVEDVEAITLASFWQVWTGFGAVAAAAILATLVSRRPGLGWGVLYIGIPAFALLVIEWARFDLVFWLMLVTWATDIFAYFAGRSIGGPKLAPKISPNKTWAGLIGGMAGAAVVGGLAAWLFGIAAELPDFLWLGAPMGLLAQLGDLYESRVKRRLGVKDSGTLLPGHGGVLDRVDGLLPVILATLLVLIASLA
ncbi:MAG TPA: phosphatidate cytidylyltransferase [Allosphingosinicella sp.]|jgi:phosphatidate cytidylyltransferase|nr:phosphatidate cytidylyltransferase [Allosphingosinicella sp.]